MSLRNSAQPEPPCPSKTAKKDTFFVYTFPAAPGFFKSRTIETLSSLYPRAIPLWVLAAYAWIAPQGFYEILEGNIFGTLLFPFNILRSAGFARLEMVAKFLELVYKGLFFMISIADWLIFDYLLRWLLYLGDTIVLSLLSYVADVRLFAEFEF